MRVIFFLIAAGGTVALGFLAAFAWAVGSGQYDDTATPPIRILFDDVPPAPSIPTEGPVHAEFRR